MAGRAYPSLTCPQFTPIKYSPRKKLRCLHPAPCPRSRTIDSAAAVEVQSGYKLLILQANRLYTHFPLTTGFGASYWVISFQYCGKACPWKCRGSKVTFRLGHGPGEGLRAFVYSSLRGRVQTLANRRLWSFFFCA